MKKKFRNFRNRSLKDALMKKNFPRSKSVTGREKSKNNKKYNININNINRINIIKNKEQKNENNNNFDSLDLDFNYKNENDIADKVYKANKLKIKESEIEDEEINSLNEQIRNIMLKNFEIQTNIENQLNMRYIYEKNQKSIASYINDLNYRFRNYDNTIYQFESSIKKIKKENRDLQNEYDKKIEAIENENEKLKKRIRDRIELYMHQKGQIDEKSAKTQNLENEIQIQKDIIKERVDINKKKMNDLENKYDKMYRKIIDIEVNCEDKKVKKMLENNLFTIEERQNVIESTKNKTQDKDKYKKKEDDKGDIYHKIEDYELNNDELLLELKELTKEYEKLTNNGSKSKENSKEKNQRYSIRSTMKSTASNFMKTQSDNKFK